MPLGRFLLCLHSHMPYVLSHGRSPHGTDWIDESAVECYLPLLDVLDRLTAKGIKPKWTVNLTPILVEQLSDPAFHQDFESYCQAKIDAAVNDSLKFQDEGNLMMLALAEMWRRWYTTRLAQFKSIDRDIVGAFRRYQDLGAIEIITCAATHGYLPLLGTEESVAAQVKLGVDSYRKHFGRDPKGIWLPECAYRPAYEWRPPVGSGGPLQRRGVEEHLADNGLRYFLVDSHMIRGGQPLGTYAANFPQLAELFARSSKYFVPPEEERTEYEPYRLPNGVCVFARDPQTTVKVWSGVHGYPGDPAYLEFHKQLYPGRLRYWRISEDKQDLGAKEPYDPWRAFDRIAAHAQDLVRTIKSTLASHRGATGREGVVTAMYDTELFGHWWWEGPEFLYELAVALAADPEVVCETGSEILDSEAPDATITLPEGSWGEGGYHYIWLNSDNTWTWDQLYPLQARLRDLASRPSSGVAREVLTQAARELLLAEASDWQFLISTYSAKDYAETRFSDHVERCERLLTLSERLADGEPLAAEDRSFLEDCQSKDAAFRDLNVDLWSSNSLAASTVNRI